MSTGQLRNSTGQEGVGDVPDDPAWYQFGWQHIQNVVANMLRTRRPSTEPDEPDEPDEFHDADSYLPPPRGWWSPISQDEFWETIDKIQQLPGSPEKVKGRNTEDRDTETDRSPDMQRVRGKSDYYRWWPDKFEEDEDYIIKLSNHQVDLPLTDHFIKQMVTYLCHHLIEELNGWAYQVGLNFEWNIRTEYSAAEYVLRLIPAYKTEEAWGNETEEGYQNLHRLQVELTDRESKLNEIFKQFDKVQMLEKYGWFAGVNGLDDRLLDFKKKQMSKADWDNIYRAGMSKLYQIMKKDGNTDLEFLCIQFLIHDSEYIERFVEEMTPYAISKEVAAGEPWEGNGLRRHYFEGTFLEKWYGLSEEDKATLAQAEKEAAEEQKKHEEFFRNWRAHLDAQRDDESESDDDWHSAEEDWHSGEEDNFGGGGKRKSRKKTKKRKSRKKTKKRKSRKKTKKRKSRKKKTKRKTKKKYKKKSKRR
jgi:hypothetical protein